MQRARTNDTSRNAEQVLLEGYRRMTPAQKLEQVRSLNRAVRSLALADVRRRHPDADEHTQALLVAARWIPPELMLRAFGWKPAGRT